MNSIKEFIFILIITSNFLCVPVSSDDVVEAYNLIKDLEPTTPQVDLNYNFCIQLPCLQEN